MAWMPLCGLGQTPKVFTQFQALSASGSTDDNADLSHPGEKFFIEITGKKSGKINGGSTRKGMEGMIEATNFSQTLSRKNDVNISFNKNGVNFETISFIKPIDKSTTFLSNSMAHSENLTKVKFRFYAPNPSGAMTNYYTVELTNARIEKIETNISSSELNYERIELSFEQMTTNWTNGGYEFTAP